MNKLMPRPALQLTWIFAALGIAMPLANAAENAGQIRGGEKTYKQICAQCHEANIGPRITGRGLALPAIRYFVRNGHNAMPAWRPTEISDAELIELADWLQATPPATTGGQP
ncbi:Cytochrome c, mono-and diheme variants [Collimonas sp. OK607]|uniref:c-type cytochrome n=1 Tax=Collimonas sp. OK607 TaxID=1798194 RepID=UPI0008EA9FAF|nr:cytochrome c [Collimonas sp. OK607]SFB27712.1 Cytochrome c, mono-and diheme variants [Collimonas sp. OK607]